MRFVTKREYWDLEDSGLLETLPCPAPWHLKTIQDAVAFSRLHMLRGKTIAEIGGGNSRLLPTLARQNHCVNIEKFEGCGAGPTENALPSEISVIDAYLGHTGALLAKETFDAAFSISVIEHVAPEDMEFFFHDNARILKKNSLSLHLIDISCSDTPSSHMQKRFSMIKQHFFKFFTPLSHEIIAEDDLHFRCEYATNPDNVTHSWAQIVPDARTIFETHQICSIVLAGYAR